MYRQIQCANDTEFIKFNINKSKVIGDLTSQIFDPQPLFKFFKIILQHISLINSLIIRHI